MNRMFTRATLAGMVAGALVNGIPQASADVIYSWHTVSSTINGVPVAPTGSGQIVLTDAGFHAGTVSVTTTTFPPLQVSETLNGVVSASFQAFTAGAVST